MPAQHPGIVQRDHRRHLAAQPRESPQVEVGSVQVVQVQDVGAARRQFKQMPAAGKIEVLVAEHYSQRTPRAAHARESRLPDGKFVSRRSQSLAQKWR